MWIRIKFSSYIVGSQIKSKTDPKTSRNSNLRILFRNKDKQLKEEIFLVGKFGAESLYYYLTV